MPYRTVKPAYPALEVEIACRQIKKKDIAKAVGISADYLSKKLTGRVDFWWKEVGIIQALFPDIPAEKLFEHTP